MVDSTDVELATHGKDIQADIERLNAGQSAVYSTIDTSNFEGALEVAEAIANSEPITEHLGEEFELTNVIVQAVEIQDEKTGEISEAPRVTLISRDGRVFHGTSVGLLSGIRNLFGIIGTPDAWPSPVRIVVTEERTRKGYRVFNIRPVRSSAKK